MNIMEIPGIQLSITWPNHRNVPLSVDPMKDFFFGLKCVHLEWLANRVVRGSTEQQDPSFFTRVNKTHTRKSNFLL